MTGVKVHVDHFRVVTAFEPSPAGTAQNKFQNQKISSVISKIRS